MDDQTMGVKNKADALAILAVADASLRRLHLTPNAAKSKVLTLAQARRHFHLDINARLDRLEKLPCRTLAEKRSCRRAVLQVWQQARRHERVGEWGKILKRIYRLAGKARCGVLRRRAALDIL